MLEKNLETCLNNSFKKAHAEKHEFVTTEHLLLSLLDNEDALNVLASCDVDVEVLRKELTEFIDNHAPKSETETKEIQPTLSYQRVIQRAVFHVQSSGKGVVKPINLLVAIFSEKECHSVFLLSKQGIGRLDIVSFISHGKPESSNEIRHYLCNPWTRCCYSKTSSCPQDGSAKG